MYAYVCMYVYLHLHLYLYLSICIYIISVYIYPISRSTISLPPTVVPYSTACAEAACARHMQPTHPTAIEMASPDLQQHVDGRRRFEATRAIVSPPAALLCQHWYFCTSKPSKLSTE